MLCVPSFGVFSASRYGQVTPPSADILMLTSAVLIPLAVVPATSQVTSCMLFCAHASKVACEVTLNGPVLANTTCVVARCVCPPNGEPSSRTTSEKSIVRATLGITSQVGVRLLASTEEKT